jgi:hypothetical protein
MKVVREWGFAKSEAAAWRFESGAKALGQTKLASCFRCLNCSVISVVPIMSLLRLTSQVIVVVTIKPMSLLL